MSKSTCAVCYDMFGKKSVVVCVVCSTVACKKCVKTNILSSEKDVITCINIGCNFQWSEKFVCENLSKSFYNKEWRNHQTKVRINNIMAKLPLAMTYVNIEIQKRELNAEILHMENIYKQKKIILQQLRENTFNLKMDITDCPTSILRNELKVVYNTEKLKIKTTNLELLDIKKNIKDNRRKLYRLDDKNPLLNVKYIHPCPKEGCNAFINDRGHCDVCKTNVCLKCNNIEENEDHNCNPDDITSFSLIKRNTKPCPICGTRIEKISGCDHMWCTAIHNGELCKTAFSYSTGKLLRPEENTNPHYFNWLAEQRAKGINVDDIIDNIGFGGRRIIFVPSEVMCSLYMSGVSRTQYVRMVQTVMHIGLVSLPMIEDTISPDPEKNMDLTVKYILKDITDMKFHSELKKRFKLEEKNHGIYDILSMFFKCMSDLFIKIINTDMIIRKVQVVIEMEQAREYTNQELINLSKRLNIKCKLQINNDWELV